MPLACVFVNQFTILTTASQYGTDEKLHDEVKDYLTALGVYGDPLPHDYAVQYRMVLDVDCNGWSSRILTLFASGALVLRSAVYSSFLDGYLQPYVHYVPVRMDYSYLVSSSAVRRG